MKPFNVEIWPRSSPDRFEGQWIGEFDYDEWGALWTDLGVTEDQVDAWRSSGPWKPLLPAFAEVSKLIAIDEGKVQFERSAIGSLRDEVKTLLASNYVGKPMDLLKLLAQACDQIGEGDALIVVHPFGRAALAEATNELEVNLPILVEIQDHQTERVMPLIVGQASSDVWSALMEDIGITSAQTQNWLDRWGAPPSEPTGSLLVSGFPQFSRLFQVILFGAVEVEPFNVSVLHEECAHLKPVMKQEASRQFLNLIEEACIRAGSSPPAAVFIRR